MTAQVSYIYGAQPWGEPVDDVVAVAERVLEMAKSGELRALAVAGITADGCVWTDSASVPGRLTELIGVVGRLQHRLTAEVEE